MTFDAPVVLFIAPVVGLAIWLAALWARGTRIRRAARWSAETAVRARNAGRFGATGLGAAALLGAVALAGPRWGEETLVAETRGLSLVLAIDISRSMMAEDVRPSRLGRALREARRLVQDLDGDRLGLIGFAGTSYVLSPLSVDGSALMLYLEALEPDIVSEGGTALGPALTQGVELLRAGTEAADRVLVVLTDGEAHDSLEPVLLQARAVAEAGVRLILVAEGRTEPARIPLRDEHGALLGYQEDENGEQVRTTRRDDVLSAIADAARGSIVAADLADQAGAVRELVASYKRAAASETRTNRGRPRGWIPLSAAILILLAQSLSRRTAALVTIILGAVVWPAAAQQPAPSHPRTPGQRAWDAGDSAAAAQAALAEAASQNSPRAWYNAGTAALAARDAAAARAALTRAAQSLDPDLRFRSLFNLGLAALAQAATDSAGGDAQLAEAQQAYREALLLRPADAAAKWNLELATRERQRQSGGGGGGGGGGGENENEQQPNPGAGQDSSRAPPPPDPRSLSRNQAEQILQSIGQEELRTRRDRTGGTRRAARTRSKDW